MADQDNNLVGGEGEDLLAHLDDADIASVLTQAGVEFEDLTSAVDDEPRPDDLTPGILGRSDEEKEKRLCTRVLAHEWTADGSAMRVKLPFEGFMAGFTVSPLNCMHTKCDSSFEKRLAIHLVDAHNFLLGLDLENPDKVVSAIMWFLDARRAGDEDREQRAIDNLFEATRMPTESKKVADVYRIWHRNPSDPHHSHWQVGKQSNDYDSIAKRLEEIRSHGPSDWEYVLTHNVNYESELDHIHPKGKEDVEESV